ncbi:MAG: hypothetical protein V7727_02115 [Sneathiella sp.]
MIDPDTLTGAVAIIGMLMVLVIYYGTKATVTRLRQTKPTTSLPFRMTLLDHVETASSENGRAK